MKKHLTKLETLEYISKMDKGGSLFIAEDAPLFKMFKSNDKFDDEQYYGFYDNSGWDMYILNASDHPVMIKAPKEIIYEDYIATSDKSCICFIFHDKENAMMKYVIADDNASFLAKDMIKAKMIVDFGDICLTREECVKRCRDMYNNAGPWSNAKISNIRKTLKNMLAQVNNFIKSELFTDHMKEIEKDLNTGIEV